MNRHELGSSCRYPESVGLNLLFHLIPFGRAEEPLLELADLKRRLTFFPFLRSSQSDGKDTKLRSPAVEGVGVAGDHVAPRVVRWILNHVDLSEDDCLVSLLWPERSVMISSLTHGPLTGGISLHVKTDTLVQRWRAY